MRRCISPLATVLPTAQNGFVYFFETSGLEKPHEEQFESIDRRLLRFLYADWLRKHPAS